MYETQNECEYGDAHRQTVNSDRGSKFLNDEGRSHGTDAPRKVEKADAGGHIFGRKLRGAEVGGGIGEAIAEAIQGDADCRKRPRVKAKESHAQAEEEKTKAQHF